jgi:thioredoxin-dependent peroxiredoxin
VKRKTRHGAATTKEFVSTQTKKNSHACPSQSHVLPLLQAHGGGARACAAFSGGALERAGEWRWEEGGGAIGARRAGARFFFLAILPHPQPHHQNPHHTRTTQALAPGDKMADYPDYYRVLKTHKGASVSVVTGMEGGEHSPRVCFPSPSMRNSQPPSFRPPRPVSTKTHKQIQTALSKLDNGKPLVIAFYPAASTPGCTKEMCAFRDAWRELQAAGATVVGISGDDPAKNARFAAEHNLPFDLLSDSGNFLRKAFGVKGDFLGLLPGRETIVVKKGVVKKVFNSQFGIDEHIAEALEAVKA